MESLESYLDRLASDAPVPGGGSAAAVTGAAAAALLAMVARIAGRSPRNAEHAERLAAIAARADALRTALQRARECDEEAFSAVVAAQALPRASDDERLARRQALDQALARAAEEPLRAAALDLAVLELAGSLFAAPIDALVSDIGSAAELAYAALLGAGYNVRVNHRYMRDAAVIGPQRSSLEAHETRARALLEGTRAELKERLGGGKP